VSATDIEHATACMPTTDLAIMKRLKLLLAEALIV
jgi:hypothetical protein